MTRMWMLDPRGMCREHLLSEHGELHQLVGTIRNHPHGMAIARGHAKKGNICTRWINDRHTELVFEMDDRGYDHDSPLDYTDEIDLGTMNIEKNRDDLMDRCSKCRELREELLS